MSGAELAALRRWLMFSAAEAARWVAVDERHPQGLDERAWNRWEAQSARVPAGIAARVRELVAWAEAAYGEALRALRDMAGPSGHDQPGIDQPGDDQPGDDQPGIDQPGDDQPGIDQPGDDQPGIDQPGGDQPGTDQPGLDQPELPRLVWYREADDFPGPRVYWRPHCAVLARMVAEGRARLVAFDAVAYGAWRREAGMPDGEAARAAWAVGVALTGS